MILFEHEPGYFIWEIIIFTIFIMVLKKMAWKPLCKYLLERRKIISDSLASTESLKKEIDQLIKENEVLKAKTLAEISTTHELTNEYIKSILLEAKMKAKADYTFIIEEAMPYIQQLEHAAINDIKNKTGLLIVEIAEKVLRKELSGPGDQEIQIKRIMKNQHLP